MKENIYFLLSHARISDFIDILVISVCLYGLYAWLRQSSSKTFPAVLLGLSVVFATAKVFNMYVTSLVFQTGFTIGIIVLVLVFQEDIRHGFERISLWGLFQSKNNRLPSNTTADTIVDCVYRMAEERTGALIVLVGAQSVARNIHGGIVIEGKISEPLLLSLFDHHSPGHDGGVIIEGDRIKLFSVHLPLSRNVGEVGPGGTRHTAALGLSEKCDAYIIVTSEERGTVSVAFDGHLQEIESPAVLKDRIDTFYRETLRAPYRKSEGGAYWPSLFAKIGCFALSCVLWAFLTLEGQEVVQRTFKTPVQYSNLNDAIVLDGTQEECSVTLVGPKFAFNTLASERLIASVDVSNISSTGKHVITLDRDNFQVPAPFSITSITPRKLELKSYKLIEKQVKVSLQLVEKSLPNGLGIQYIEVVPAEASLLVREGHEDSVTNIRNKPIDLASLTSGENEVLLEFENMPHVKLKPKTSIRAKITLGSQ